MEIKATCKFDMDSVRAMTHLTTNKRFRPKRRLAVKTALCALLLLLVAAAWLTLGFDPVWVVAMGIYLLVMAWEYFAYFALPKINYRGLGKLREAENEYVFCDDSIRLLTRSDGYNAEGEISYAVLVKVYETGKYFFLYHTKGQAFIVDKSTLVGGTADDVRRKLTDHVKGKYIVCNY